jgi:hypothetical protein
MRLLWACLCLALLATPAFAQSTATREVPGYLDTNGNFHQSQFVLNGFGTLSVSATTSTLLSTITANSSGTAWPAQPGPSVVANFTAGILYVCPFGGTCSASGATEGLQLAAGTAYQFPVMSTNATVYAASAGAIQVTW